MESTQVLDEGSVKPLKPKGFLIQVPSNKEPKDGRNKFGVEEKAKELSKKRKHSIKHLTYRPSSSPHFSSPKKPLISVTRDLKSVSTESFYGPRQSAAETRFEFTDKFIHSQKKKQMQGREGMNDGNISKKGSRSQGSSMEIIELDNDLDSTSDEGIRVISCNNSI